MCDTKLTVLAALTAKPRPAFIRTANIDLRPKALLHTQKAHDATPRGFGPCPNTYSSIAFMDGWR
jgi:hypothetical protein